MNKPSMITIRSSSGPIACGHTYRPPITADGQERPETEPDTEHE
jgi:hypothetical protein